MWRRSAAIAVMVALIMILAAPAGAGHDHFMATPNGRCHSLASGQTSIDDPDHGGYHRYHVNVHVALAGDGTLRETAVRIARDECPA